MNTATLTLLPPRRLGAILAERRMLMSSTVAEVADGSPFTEAQLLEIEAGAAPLTEARIDAVIAAYGMHPDDLLSQRAQVVVDLDRGQLLVAEQAAALDLDAPTADEVLGAYLSLLYVLRRATPGTPLILRAHDLGILARSLRLAEPEVEARLVGLMARPTPDIEVLHRSLRRKLLLPVIGAVVVVGALGLVLVLRADSQAQITPSPSTRPGAIEVPVNPEVGLLPPANQSRNDDGTPGPVITGP